MVEEKPIDDISKKSRLRNLYKKRTSLVGAILVLVVIVAAIGSHLLISYLNNRNGNYATAKITSLEKTTTCNKGATEIEPIVANTTTFNKYSVNTRETILDYMMNCTFVAGNTNKALGYASQLEKLYQLQGNNKKLNQTEQLVVYMKDTGK